MDASSQRDIRDASVYDRGFQTVSLMSRIYSPQVVHQAAVLRILCCSWTYCACSQGGRPSYSRVRPPTIQGSNECAWKLTK